MSNHHNSKRQPLKGIREDSYILPARFPPSLPPSLPSLLTLIHLVICWTLDQSEGRA